MSFVLIKGNPLESWLRLGSRFIVRGSYFSRLLGRWGISHIPSDLKQMCRRSSILFFQYLPSLTLFPKKYEGVKGFPDLYRFVTDHKHFTSFTLLSKESCEKFLSCHVFFQQNYWIPRYPAKIQVGNNIWNTLLKKKNEFYQIISRDGPITAQISGQTLCCCVFLACFSKQGSNEARACARVGLGACRSPGAAKTKPSEIFGMGQARGWVPRRDGRLRCCESSHTFSRGLLPLHSTSWGSCSLVGMDAKPSLLLCSSCATQLRRLVEHSQKNAVSEGIKWCTKSGWI